MTELSHYNKLRIDKVKHFTKDYMKHEIVKIFLLKTIVINDEQLSRLKRRIALKKYLSISLKKNDNWVDDSKYDDGIIEMSDHYFQLYLVIDKVENYHFVIIKENNFSPNGMTNQLEYYKKADKFYYNLYFWNKEILLG